MLMTVICTQNFDEALVQMRKVAAQTQGFELRFDYWERLDFDGVAALRAEFSHPLIFTLRRQDQGGFYKGSEDQRLADLLQLCACVPDYIDLEYDVDPSFIDMLHARYPQIKLLASWHNFETTPADLNALLQSMVHPAFSIYKIAAKATSTADALRMLSLVRAQKNNIVVGLSMGEFGECTRVLGPVMGSVFDYACVSDEFASAPGQLTLAALLRLYKSTDAGLL